MKFKKTLCTLALFGTAVNLLASAAKSSLTPVYAALCATIVCCAAIVVQRCAGMYDASDVYPQLIPFASGLSWHL